MSGEDLVPEEISCGDQVFDIAFHPTSDFLATASIDGVVEVWKYGIGEGANQKLFTSSHHTSSCRGIRFNEKGDVLFSISSDLSLKGMDGNGNLVLNYENAHTNPINRIHIINEHNLVTGDDIGEVKLWDLRVGSQDKAAVMQWHLHEDFISGFAYNSGASTLISVSGDSTLAMYDFRNKKMTCRSDEQESELQCVQILKGGRKVVAGTQDGVMLLFSWDDWGDCSDRFPGHPETVDSMWKIDESTVITGSSDGFLRVVSLHPNKILGVIGDHEEFPVEGMCASRDGRVLGSFAHDEVIRFWDISMFVDDDGDEFDAEDEEVSGVKAGAAKVSKKDKKALKNAQKSATTAVPVGADGDAASDDDGEWEDCDSDEEGSGSDEGEGDEVDGEAVEMEGDSDEGSEEGSEMEESDGGSESDSDGDEDSDDSDAGRKAPKKLPTASEKFFADL
eukprot:CAMPEP_0184973698 /NCGR_PEP_ID=MMETSP1098-20130426/5365_1 /TAXON_ID=89044 /ORGANISM="Spumella elongata, Strain CCAP 955/1" /LENGTH=448 /DNA_ID=CAMNT_0027496169 /DNA_START=46 /DNA_END=1392 /DNA_ORIENTATION=-